MTLATFFTPEKQLIDTQYAELFTRFFRSGMLAWFTQGLGAKAPMPRTDATTLGRGLLETWELGYRRAQADEVAIKVGSKPDYLGKWVDVRILAYLADNA